MRRRLLVPALVICIVALLALAACASGPTWEPHAGAMTTAQLRAKLASTDIADLSGVSVSEAADRRNDALTSLRKEEGGTKIADVLTTAFSGTAAGVPVYVGVGQYSGQPAIFVVEAYGATGGKLDHKRLWVLSMDGTPLFSSAAE